VKVKARLPVARKPAKNEGTRDRDLEKRLTEALKREAEALEQQAATSEILRVISSSPGDIQPVFDAIAANAARLCDAVNGLVIRFDGQLLHLAAHHNVDPERLDALRQAYPRPPSRGALSGRAILTRAVVHVPDVSKDAEYMLPAATTIGYRSVLAVPMMHEGVARGTILVARDVVAPFSDTHIALIQTFADQAVIAIENARLFNETKEALEQQTATSEILRVISSSPTDVQPVFDVIVERAVHLCGARFGRVYRFDGGVIHMVAGYGLSAVGLGEVQRVFPRPASDDTIAGRVILTRQPVFIRDIEREEGVPALSRGMIKALETRSQVTIPMLRAGEPIGAMTLGWAEPEAFDEQQIALLKTFADQAVIAVENVRLFTELEGRNRDLTSAHAQVTEALEQQTATSEILRVISSSPTILAPVLDAVAKTAARLCDANNASLYRVEGDLMRKVAGHGFVPTTIEVGATRPVTRGTVSGRAMLERRTLHIPDLLSEVDSESPETRDNVRRQGIRSMVGTPLLREGVPIGVILVYRTEVRPFSDKQIGLLQTFADQAVIAIENVRLFTELQASNRELTTALDTQTATSDVLRVISQSQTDVQPVFDAIVASAVRLLRAHSGVLTRIVGDQIEVAALTSHDAVAAAALGGLFPQPLRSEAAHAQAIRDRAPVNIADIADAYPDPRRRDAARDYARVSGSRSLVVVPMLRLDEAIGSIGVTRRESGGFTDDEIALLKTFADQAVIAIENVRLFNELEGRNRDLTATSEILRVISSSPTDVQPVFDTIVKSAVRLCDGLFSAVFQFDGELIHQVAQHNYTPEGLEQAHRIYPARPTRALLTGRAILERTVVHVPDVELDAEFQHKALSRAVGWRSGLFVPMLREGAPIGIVVVARAETGPFSDTEIELLKTFADQAVIAVENVRLFKELQARTGELTQSVEKLTALGEVSQALSSTLDVETVLDTIVSRASQLAGAAGCSIYEYDAVAEQFELRATHNDDAKFVEALRAAPLRKGEGLMGRAAEMREPIQIPDITQPGAYQSSVRDTLIRFGYRALLSVPLLREDQIIGSLSFNRKAPGEFPPEVVDVLKTFATQSALAIQNARLFREIADKSAQLEAASRHKSEFLANMSHELRTPLNAIIGFSEVLTERMFGELNDKQAEYLRDIHASGTHLLSLINDILDLSKIEAGRMELERSDFSLPTAIDNALTLVRERATRRGITLGAAIHDGIGEVSGDERKIRQVLLNLLSNAIKFTPEGGRIEVKAVPEDGAVEVSVHDTGVGIAQEDQEAVFEEFRQVGASAAKQEGTGLGLALCRKFVELHGGTIWVTSAVGAGSTFTFTLPVQR
jgi:GAF domain-containing protein